MRGERYGVSTCCAAGSTYDSRRVEAGMGVRGAAWAESSDGVDFAQQAIAAGAVAVVTERDAGVAPGAGPAEGRIAV